MSALDILDAALVAQPGHQAGSSLDAWTDVQCDCCCAIEGALPATTTGAGLTPAQVAQIQAESRREWAHWPELLVLGIVAGAAVSALYPWGWA